MELESFLTNHDITRQQLIDIAILIGTDFNQGIRGIGPKTALRLIKKNGNIENLQANIKLFLTKDFEAVREIFLKPSVTNNYSLELP